MANIEKLNWIYEQYKDNFQQHVLPDFYNCLWQLMVNEIHKGKKKCFTAQINNWKVYLGLVIADEPGYIPMAVFSHKNLAICECLAYELSNKIFGVKESEANLIIWSSIHIGNNKAS